MTDYSVLITDHDSGITIYEFVRAENPNLAYVKTMQNHYENDSDDWPTHTVELVIKGHHSSLYGG